ncbi:hypothetical protein CTheo_2999 [Ceratobasidium theobromae]|uniref:Xylanolytic transcriptional activator regulatory domain-containing protein n=1 Tax=Ceratobasidium theobromae TaxID=1582974 RepID=A0A5N5QPN7_9AGAM|nr:hypothetical protein CTheo_2999 [Ceratobasidium theobromae]
MSVLRQESVRSSSTASDEPAGVTSAKPATLRKNQASDCNVPRLLVGLNDCYRRVTNVESKNDDAHRPCKSCVRAHANVIANAVKRGKPFPARPDCVYDGDSPASYDINETVDLNERNDLAQKILLTSAISPTSETSPQTSSSSQAAANTIYTQLNQTSYSAPSTLFDSMWARSPIFDPPLEDIGSYGFVRPRTEATAPPEMLLDLPPLELVITLVDVFFENWPFGRHMLHMPSFKQRVRLAPSDPKFPSVALLHGICALGAIYLPQPGAPSEEIRPDEPARGNMFRTDEQVSRVLEGMASFGEHQSMVAQIKALNDARTGKRLLEGLQAIICVCWCHSWADLWIMSGTAMRLSIPLGLCGARGYDEILWGPNFGDTYPNFKENILPPTSDFVELEIRKRTFWMAFLTDRIHCAATAWPGALDELDVGQSLPYPLEMFEAATLPGPEIPPPQKLSTTDMLTNHPPGLTDDMILFIKTLELLSRVTVFNNRVRTRYEDATNVSAAPAFRMLDDTITSFIQSIPMEYQNIFGPSGLRALRPLILSVPQVARILLHDPHRKLEDPNDTSTHECLLASRAILNVTYKLQSSSARFKLLAPTFVFVWSISGKSLLRNYAQSLKNADYANALIYREEVRFLGHSAFRLGESFAIGIRHGLVLQELLDRVDKMYPLPDGCSWPSPMA